MRTFLLIANALVAFVFTVFFGYTFVGRDHIDVLAREFVTAKTQQYVTPAVDVAEEALLSHVVRRVLPKARTVAFEAEIAEFRAQPALYIQRLTAAQEPPKADSVLGAVFGEGVWMEGANSGALQQGAPAAVYGPSDRT